MKLKVAELFSSYANEAAAAPRVPVRRGPIGYFAPAVERTRLSRRSLRENGLATTINAKPSRLDRVTRGDKILKNMSERGIIKETSVNFLKAALDPFHDQPTGALAGWPDAESSPSVVRKVRKSYTIRKPIGITEDTYNFAVTLWPNQIPNIYSDYSATGQMVLSAVAGTTGQIIGGVTIEAIAGSASFGPTTQPLISLSADEFMLGNSRIIGVGYEISDDTADIYRQGHSFHARIPFEYAGSDRLYNFATSTSTPGAQALVAPAFRPPYNSPEMIIYPNSVDWPTREGCYVVGAVGSENPPSYPTSTNIGYLKTEPVQSVLTPVEVSLPTPLSTAPYTMPLDKVSNLDISRSIFIGCNKEGVYTLTVHWIIESFPTHQDGDILVLATPSAEYDPEALAMYEYAQQTLPVAVRLGMNPTGEWWSDVISKATEFLAPTASLLGFPSVAPLITTGGNALARAVRGNNTRRGNAANRNRKK